MLSVIYESAGSNGLAGHAISHLSAEAQTVRRLVATVQPPKYSLQGE